MARLSLPIEDIKPSYTVVIVGSGYGGAISACRLARAGQSVCVLERGREFQPGDFPETERAALAEYQVDTPPGHAGSRIGLYDFRVNPEISLLVGCGLGGTSLINAGVALRPDPRVFRCGSWPKELAEDLETLSVGYSLAEQMLRPNPYPATFPLLPKMAAHEASARAMGKPLMRAPINVTFQDGPNPVGVEQKACVLCGNCVTGCNHRAKNTTAMNYLPDAHRHGAEIFTEADVRYLEKRHGRWVVHYQVIGSGQTAYDAPTQFVLADLVILAAGTLGSTEILLRSRERGLPLSGALGQRFTGNGDMLAFAYNCAPEVNGIGWTGQAPDGPPVGPTITSMIVLRGDESAGQDVLVEEGAIPSAIATFASDAMRAVADLKRVVRGPTAPPEHRSIEAAGRASQTYLVMSLDDDEGVMSLADDRLRVSWPGAGREGDLYIGSQRAQEAAEAIGGTYLRDPLWTDPLGNRLITVHPLGGCAMGGDASRGVVNHRCQVFAGASGTEVHDGLHVCDGSIIPSPLGVNPLLTISALTERACHLLAEDRGWHIDYTLPRAAPPLEDAGEAKVGIQFSERMRGFFEGGVTDDYQRGAHEGEASGSTFEFTVTIVSEDLEDMLARPEHEARIYGTVAAPALSESPLAVSEGVFHLFTEDAAQPGYRFMRYQMRLTSTAGKHYWFEGFKHIGNDSPLDAWSDSTTLYITIHDGQDASTGVLGKGILHIGTADVARLARTIEARGTHGLFAKSKAEMQFARYFLGAEFETYLRDIAKW